MPEPNAPAAAHFAVALPRRFAAVLADAQGAIAGIGASTDASGARLLDPEALRCLHEVYRLRVELEVETAGVLWRTAEIVCALTDAIEVLNRRRPVSSARGSWLQGLSRAEIVERREGTAATGKRMSRGIPLSRAANDPLYRDEAA